MTLSVVDGRLVVEDICQICALEKNQYVVQWICLDCWKAMSNGR